MKKDIKTWSTPFTAEETRTIPCNLCGGHFFTKALQCDGYSFVRCGDCGLVQANPQPTKAAIQRRYRDGHGLDYLNYELGNEKAFLELQLLALQDAGFDEIEATLRAQVPQKPRILDVGCATGALLETLTSRGWDCCGVELSGPQADYGRNKRGLRIFNKTLEETAFPDDYLDVITASHLIEHLNDPTSFVREAFRILRPGGYIIITTPNIDGLQARLMGGRWRSAIFDHLYLFSRKTLQRLLVSSGFIIQRTVTWGGIGKGIAPEGIKKIADRWAKPLGFGDVMLVRALKPEGD